MRRSGTIFVVEDDPDDVSLISYAFRSADIENPIRWIKDGNTLRQQMDSARLAGTREEMPLLVVIDGKLPGSNAFEILRWIRAQPQYINLLIVFLTGSADPGQRQSAYQAGANWYLVKSTQFSELTELVRRIQEFWSDEAESGWCG